MSSESIVGGNLFCTILVEHRRTPTDLNRATGQPTPSGYIHPGISLVVPVWRLLLAGLVEFREDADVFEGGHVALGLAALGYVAE